MAKRRENKLSLDHEEIFREALITYNNSIHSATKLTPYELFFGRTHIFNRTVQFNDEPEYLQKLNEYQQKIYPEIREKLEISTRNRIENLNKNRKIPKLLHPNDTVYRKENRRNKITPRFSKHKVKYDKNVTFVSDKNQKIHKTNIKK